jgi:hypothetical protein
MAKTIEDYQNIVELLKRALLFYANKKNYQIDHRLDGTSSATYIEFDKGMQAEFALDKLREFDEIHEKMEMDFKASVENIVTDDVENVNKLMEDLKKLGYDKNI